MFVFSGNNANIPTNPRKHRRLEEKPSDEGNPGDIPVDSDMNVDEEPNIHPHKNEGLANANVQNHTLGDLPDPPNGDKMQANQDTSTDKILAEDRIAKSDSRSILATAVYASPCATQRKILWPHLRRLAAHIRSPWILFGDFNATLTTSKRIGCAATTKPSKAFQDLIFDHGLRDMGYQGPDFTWSRGSASVRLDRFICNSYWDEVFPETNVEHLLCLRSDHRPILLRIGATRQQSHTRHFRYFTGWKSHDDFQRLVADNWPSNKYMTETLIHFTKAADTWNKTVFGYIGTKKKILMACIRGIKKSLASRPSRFLRNLESELLIELENLLDQEELLWKQKSRSDWIAQGDCNTRYFHRKAISRKQHNKITSLKLQNDTWCEDDSILQEEAVRYFTSIFSLDKVPGSPFSTTVSYPKLPPELMQHLDEIPSDEEIHAALRFQLARDNGFQKVQIHSDCLKAVTTVQDDAAGSNSNPLVRAIVKLRRGNWDTEVEWIPRESNRPADKLTKQADEAQHKLLMLETPPENLLSLLENDITDSSFHFAI
ncbi:hypothetical protein V6N13_037436 [Hibiscus sabdariffa]